MWCGTTYTPYVVGATISPYIWVGMGTNKGYYYTITLLFGLKLYIYKKGIFNLFSNFTVISVIKVYKSPESMINKGF